MFKHKHKWQIVSAKESEAGGVLTALQGQILVTYVLWCCACCWELKSEMLPGPFAPDINELSKLRNYTRDVE